MKKRVLENGGWIRGDFEGHYEASGDPRGDHGVRALALRVVHGRVRNAVKSGPPSGEALRQSTLPAWVSFDDEVVHDLTLEDVHVVDWKAEALADDLATARGMIRGTLYAKTAKPPLGCLPWILLLLLLFLLLALASLFVPSCHKLAGRSIDGIAHRVAEPAHDVDAGTTTHDAGTATSPAHDGGTAAHVATAVHVATTLDGGSRPSEPATTNGVQGSNGRDRDANGSGGNGVGAGNGAAGGNGSGGGCGEGSGSGGGCGDGSGGGCGNGSGSGGGCGDGSGGGATAGGGSGVGSTNDADGADGANGANHVNHGGRKRADSLDVDEAVEHPEQFFQCGKRITLSGDLLFDHDKDELRDESIPVLKKVSRLIHARSNRDLVVDVVGHTDTTGSEWYNDGLSLRRANTVARFLRDDHAIDREHIRVGGHGSREALVPSGTVADQAPNRRVEIVVDCAK